jgi:protein PhnA
MQEAHQNEVNSYLNDLLPRCASKCELCNSAENLAVLEIGPIQSPNIDKCIIACKTCKTQIESTKLNPQHWFCLNESAWTQLPAVQVQAFRLLKKLSSEDWAQDLLDQIYLEDDVRAWAEDIEEEENSVLIKDANGETLVAGDTVTVLKDLDVKGTSFVAKRGTVVRNIRTGSDPELVEGRVNGTLIYLKTCFIKKS